jgi:6,7-dimethyl-8-ribityllumazine synthase
MSAAGAPIIELPKIPGAKIAIISSQWHMDICNALVNGAQRACVLAGVSKVRTDWVPGSFELPLAAATLLEDGYDAVIALGLILRGETPHFDYVCQGVTYGIIKSSLSLMKPIGFGILMCDTMEQALARSGLPGSSEDKGFEAASAAIRMLEFQNSSKLAK